MNILWVKTELLHPLDKGGRIRSYHMLRRLREQHHVTYVALDDGTASADHRDLAAEYCDELVMVPFNATDPGTAGFYMDLLQNLTSSLPYAVARYRSELMFRAIAGAVANGEVDVLVCDFLAPALNVPDDLPCATVLFEHNVEARIWERRAMVADGWLRHAYMRSQWRRMQRLESSQCRRFGRVVAVSTDDVEQLCRDYGITHASPVPTGVDGEYFTPSGSVTRRPHELVFTGSMDWMPNEDAMLFFTREILPRVRTAIPDVTLSIVGRNPTDRVVALGQSEPGVTVTGRVLDVRPYIERASAFVVPLRVGGGTRLKIFEAMAMACPVISTTIGAEGLPIEDGVHALVADDPEEFAAAIVQLLHAPDRAATMGDQAARYVREKFSWAGIADEFARTCASLLERRTSVPQSLHTVSTT